MEWRLSGNAESVTLYFRVEGQPVIPDVGTPISFTARNNLGAISQRYDFNQPVDAVPTQMTASLTADLSQLVEGVLFESRYFRADFVYKGKSYFTEHSYRLHKFVPMTASPESVRAIVGADYDELPDSDISVFGAYVTLYGALGVSLDAALARSDYVGLKANEAVSLRAVLDVLPSLQTRLLKLEKRDNSELQRATTDFDKLELDVRTKLSLALDIISAVVDEQDTAVTPVDSFLVTAPTDVITNT